MVYFELKRAKRLRKTLLILCGLCLQQLGFPEIEAGSQCWAYQILDTKLMVSDKDSGFSALRRRISTKMESIEANQVFLRRKRVQYVWIDTRADWEVESPWVVPSWQFKSLFWLSWQSPTVKALRVVSFSMRMYYSECIMRPMASWKPDLPSSWALLILTSSFFFFFPLFAASPWNLDKSNWFLEKYF